MVDRLVDRGLRLLDANSEDSVRGFVGYPGNRRQDVVQWFQKKWILLVLEVEFVIRTAIVPTGIRR